MLGSRRALLYHAASFRYLSSISHKNLQFEASAAPTPEDLSQTYKTPAAEGGGVHKEREMRRKREDGREMVKAVAVGAIETGLELGRIGKQVMDGIWDAAEKTAHGVRDSIADDTDHNSGRRRRRRVEDRSSDKFGEDLRRQDGGFDLNGRHRVEDETSDKFVEDLRQRNGGYDLNGRR